MCTFIYHCTLYFQPSALARESLYVKFDPLVRGPSPHGSQHKTPPIPTAGKIGVTPRYVCAGGWVVEQCILINCLAYTVFSRWRWMGGGTVYLN